MRFKLVATSLLAFLSLLTAAGVGTAANTPPPPPNPPLTGELLTGAVLGNLAVVCSRESHAGSQTSSYSFDVQGLASGPYPGTFFEHVSVQQNTILATPYTFGSPITGQTTIYEQVGAATAVTASFVIDGPAGHVEGTKSLLLPSVQSVCAFDRAAVEVCFAGPGSCLYEHDAFVSDFSLSAPAGTLSYQATITTTLGTSSDSGTSGVSADYQWISDFPEATRPFVFEEDFASTVAQPAPDTRDGKGCGDTNHVHVRADECK